MDWPGHRSAPWWGGAALGAYAASAVVLVLIGDGPAAAWAQRAVVIGLFGAFATTATPTMRATWSAPLLLFSLALIPITYIHSRGDVPDAAWWTLAVLSVLAAGTVAGWTWLDGEARARQARRVAAMLTLGLLVVSVAAIRLA